MTSAQPDQNSSEPPNGWSVRPLAELSAFITKGATPTTYGFKWQSTGVPFLRSECVSETGLDLTQAMLISDEANAALRRSEVKAGDILLTITGNVGRAIRLRSLGKANINQHIARVRIQPESADPEYVYQFLSQARVRDHFNTITTGQAYPQISLKQVRNCPIELPALGAQRSIAQALSELDVLLETLAAITRKKRNLKQATMQQLFSSAVRVTTSRAAWQDAPLATVVGSLEAGVSVNSIDADTPVAYGDLCVLKTSAVVDGKFLPEECKLIALADRGRARVSPVAGSIIVSRMNTPSLVGEVAYVHADFPQLFLPDRLWMARLRPDSNTCAKWLAYYLSTPKGKETVKGLATGTSGSMKNISKQALLGLSIPFPSLAEQREISGILSDMDCAIETLRARREKVFALKQAIMQQLLTGRIRLI